jgi:hypothetical protein
VALCFCCGLRSLWIEEEFHFKELDWVVKNGGFEAPFFLGFAVWWDGILQENNGSSAFKLKCLSIVVGYNSWVSKGN